MRLATMEDLWKKRAPPKPQPPLRQLLPDLDVELGAALKAAQGGGGAAAAVGVSACKALGLKNPNAKWDAADNARVFVTAVVAFLTLVSAMCEAGVRAVVDRRVFEARPFVKLARCKSGPS